MSIHRVSNPDLLRVPVQPVPLAEKVKPRSTEPDIRQWLQYVFCFNIQQVCLSKDTVHQVSAMIIHLRDIVYIALGYFKHREFPRVSNSDEPPSISAVYPVH